MNTKVSKKLQKVVDLETEPCYLEIGFQQETRNERSKSMERVKYTKFLAWMDENNVTAAEIAELLGITAPTMSKKLNGFVEFRVSEIRLICNRYHISADTYFVAYKVS